MLVFMIYDMHIQINIKFGTAKLINVYLNARANSRGGGNFWLISTLLKS